MKQFVIKTVLFFFFIAVTGFLLFSTRMIQDVSAEQCLEPGCCGFQLVYLQYQCVSLGPEEGICQALGEEPHYFCPNTDETFPDSARCSNACSEPCQKSCWSSWAKECVINSHNEPCKHDNPNSCYASYAAIQCQSQAGVNACEEATGTQEDRQCWVTGAPQPSAPPPPDPGNCDGNWYGCTGPTWCSNYNTAADCAAAGATQCACGTCACQQDRGKVAFTFFEDTNQNGVWDYTSGERRIHPNGSCNAANSMVVDGVQLWFENNQLSPDCNIENREYSGGTCTWDDDCFRDGVQTGSCHPWGWESQEYSDKCFTESKSCSECHWDNQGCVSTSSERGRACAQNGDYCNWGGPADLRHGYVYLRESETGIKDIDVVTPAGWIVSPGNYGGSNSFTVNVTTSYDRVRCEAGVKTIGLIPDYNKQCTVQLTQNSIAADESTIATVWGSSEMPGSDPTRLIIGKADYTQILDENNQPYTPPGTYHREYDGRHYYIYPSALEFENHSFDTGDFSGWQKGDGLEANVFNDGGDWTVQLQAWGMTYRHIATSWIDFDEDISGKTFKLSFKAKTHVNPDRFHQIYFDTNNGWSSDVWINPPNMTSTKNTYEFTRTMPSNGYIDRLRIVFTGNDYNDDGDNSDDIPNQPWYLAEVNIEEVVTPAVEIGGCTTGDGVACQQTTVISDLPTGDYKLHCDLATGSQKCSGNPNCNYEGGDVNCIVDGWVSCSTQDNVDLEVTCAPQCGQSAGCGNEDLGTPGPSAIQPTIYNMTENPGSQNAVPLTWSESSTVTDYWTVITYEDTGAQRTNAQLDAIATDCTDYTNGLNGVVCSYINYAAFDTNHDGVLDLTPTYSYNPELLRSNDLRVAIRGVNTTCAPHTGSNQMSTWRHSTLDLVANVVGDLYEGDGNPSASICTGPTNPANFPATTSRALSAASGGTPHTSPASSDYTIFDVPYVPSLSWGSGTTISLDITNNDLSQALACECPSPASAGNPYTCEYNNILTPTTGVDVNFWLQEYDLVNGPWWQTWGGMIYAATGSVISDIPQPCIDDGTGYCRSFMATQDIDQTDYSGSVVMSGSGNISSGDDSGYVTDRFPETEQQFAEGTFHENVLHENYDFFVREILMSEYTNTVPEAVDESSDIFSTDYTDDEDDQTRIYYAPGSVTIDPTSTIEVPDFPGTTSDRAVVLINGDLIIRDTSDIQEVVNVDQGDFLGFIVNGNITIEGSVGFDKDMTNIVQVTGDTNLEGVYVADESLIIDGYDALGFPQLVDRKFIGAGTFVGFAGVALDRDFENSVDPLTRSINNLDPVSTFVYRPDFVENLPRFMHNPGLVWQEVN